IDADTDSTNSRIKELAAQIQSKTSELDSFYKVNCLPTPSMSIGAATGALVAGPLGRLTGILSPTGKSHRQLSLPEPNVLSHDQEQLVRGYDLAMKAKFNSKERDTDDWAAFSEATDRRFKI
ncbi:hypothetical protein MMC14_002253, partial [Varicellaria rhodocarpa]|nr:hypothetical protein [Varicellaria rhodocarpa]